MSDLDLVCSACDSEILRTTSYQCPKCHKPRQVLEARIAELEAAQEKDDLLSREKTKVIVKLHARITELESADAMITNTCDLVARLETLEAAINNVIEISDKFPSSAPGLTPYNIEYRNGWDDAAGILREALEGKDGEART